MTNVEKIRSLTATYVLPAAPQATTNEVIGSRNPKILTLQAGRAIAAIAVLFHHLASGITAFITPEHPFNLFRYGYLGVDFFFVLSGFIIYWATCSKQKASSFGKFACGRLNRIFTPYLPIGIGIALAYTYLPALSASDRDWGWMTTLTLLPSDLPPALSVAWTLRFELMFYLFFGIFLTIKKVHLGFAVWGTLILAVGSSGYTADNPAILQSLKIINLEFIFGYLVALAVKNRLCASLFRNWTASLILIAIWYYLGANRPQSWLVGLAIAVMLHWIISRELTHGILVPKFLVFLGDASYAIYLIHPLIIAISMRILASVGVGAITAFIFTAILCVLTGSAYHRLYEAPVVSRINHAIRNSNQDRTAVQST